MPALVVRAPGQTAIAMSVTSVLRGRLLVGELEQNCRVAKVVGAFLGQRAPAGQVLATQLRASASERIADSTHPSAVRIVQHLHRLLVEFAHVRRRPPASRRVCEEMHGEVVPVFAHVERIAPDGGAVDLDRVGRHAPAALTLQPDADRCAHLLH